MLSFLVQLPGHPFDHVLVRLDLPDAVAAHDYEFDVFVLYLLDVGVGCDDLGLGAVLSVALVLQIAQGSRQIKITVYSTILHLAPCALNPVELDFIVWLVVVAEGLNLFVDKSNCPGISSVGTVDVLGSD